MDIRQLEEVLDRYAKGTCSPEEETWIEDWLEHNPLNRDSEWRQMSQKDKQEWVAGMYSAINQEADTAKNQTPPTRNPILRKVWYAASIAAVLAGIYFLWPRIQETVAPTQTQNIIWATIDVPVGHQTQVQLTDGTKVWLHGGSQLIYPQSFQGQTERKITIQGEGYFEVAHNPNKPFVVRTPALEARVLGTSFNVQAYPQMDTELISLTEGRLQVTLLSNQDPDQSVILHPAEALRFQSKDSTLTKTTASNYTGQDFKNGLLEFDNTPLAQVLYRIEQTYAIQVEYNELRAKDTKITGIFYATEPVKEVLKSIARSIQADIQWTSPKKATLKFKN